MKLLVVEDSPILGNSLLRGLRAEGFVVDLAETGEDAHLLLLTNAYDAIILDWMLPGISGMDLLKLLRARMASPTPVLVLSARSDISDRILGLDFGADDYLPKPFDFGELVARVRAICRRGTGQRKPNLQVGKLRIDTNGKQASVDGVELPLTRSEYSLLEALALRRGEVLTKEWLLESLHDADNDTESNVIEVFISALRKKLREVGIEDLIVTRRGLGYLIPVDPQAEQSAPLD